MQKKWGEMAKSVAKEANMEKQSKTTKIAKRGQNWPKVAKSGHKGTCVASSGQPWAKMTKSGQKQKQPKVEYARGSR